jgi:2-keto-4-pentenoate hydratase/2-oxohepta-3-ene-1,7-dioic acid hydratase in catechol pathway
MKIGRFEGPGTGRPFWGVIDLDAATVRAISGSIVDWGPLLTLRGGEPPYTDEEELELGALRLRAPLEPIAKVVAAGTTYANHVAALGLELPSEPSVFLKTVASIISPGEVITYPRLTSRLDYEGELVAVIGAPVDGGGAGAISAVIGYTVGNDVSARDLQFRDPGNGMDLFGGKALDGTGPLGPWIVTRDEFGDGSPDLELELTVDGERRQHDRTGHLIWSVGELVSYVAERSSLRPGDILFTGTAAGSGHEDGRYLQPGQEVVVTIEGIGSLRNTVGSKQA